MTSGNYFFRAKTKYKIQDGQDFFHQNGIKIDMNSIYCGWIVHNKFCHTSYVQSNVPMSDQWTDVNFVGNLNGQSFLRKLIASF